MKEKKLYKCRVHSINKHNSTCVVIPKQFGLIPHETVVIHQTKSGSIIIRPIWRVWENEQRC